MPVSTFRKREQFTTPPPPPPPPHPARRPTAPPVAESSGTYRLRPLPQHLHHRCHNDPRHRLHVSGGAGPQTLTHRHRRRLHSWPRHEGATHQAQARGFVEGAPPWGRRRRRRRPSGRGQCVTQPPPSPAPSAPGGGASPAAA